MAIPAGRTIVPRPVKTRSAPSLATAIFGFVALGAVIAAAAGWYAVGVRSAEFRRDALAEAIAVRARTLELDLGRTLYREWRNARIIADDIAGRDESAVRSSLDLVVGKGSRVSWAGIAAIDGTVTAASGGLLEGQNVSQRPWFQRGLEGDFAGDVHAAVLLERLLPTQGGEPRRFLDLATPIRNGQGSVTGVLGLHLDYRWVLDHMRETAAALEIGAFVIDRQGALVMGTDGTLGATADLASLRAATAGAAFTGVETWPDGKVYFTTVIPQVAYRDLPSFGWSIVARVGHDAIESRPALRILAVPAAFGLVLVLMTLLFVQLFARPYGRLAASAGAIMKGEDVYPYETHSTAEAQTLSAAVAQLQARILPVTNRQMTGGAPGP